jgi:hypothetical protein
MKHLKRANVLRKKADKLLGIRNGD